jgi:hypothetical protein
VAASLTRYSGWTAVLVAPLASMSGAVALASSGVRTWIVHLALVSQQAVRPSRRSARFRTSPRDLALVQMVLLAVAAGVVLRTVIGESRVSFRTILGAISVYLIFGLLFTSLYVAIDRLQAGPFFGNVSEPETRDSSSSALRH